MPGDGIPFHQDVFLVGDSSVVLETSGIRVTIPLGPAKAFKLSYRAELSYSTSSSKVKL